MGTCKVRKVTKAGKDVTTVIFRRWKDSGSVIALFPHDAGDGSVGSCCSYEHVGQHGSADYRGVMEATDPVRMDTSEASDALDLFEELSKIGYVLDVHVRALRSDIGKNR